MNAKKCDRCGEYYDEYGLAKELLAKQNPNGVILACFFGDEFNQLESFDLCKDCMKKVENFVKNKE